MPAQGGSGCGAAEPARVGAVTFLRYFLYIVAGALASSALGGAFACLVAVISPEFVRTLFSPVASDTGTSLVRYAAAVGMIWGIFLGTAVMAFSLGLVTLVNAARVIRKRADAAELASRRPSPE